MILPIKGRIDSANAAQVEQALQSQIAGQTDLVLDAQELTYISSAGLRLILHMRKDHPELRIIRVNPDIYQILEMTGFTEMMPVEKTCREVSLEGAEEIGRGANGTIYRIARDSVVKVYKHPEALESIRHEREMAKLALILGIPTAISYDVVKVGDSYGAVFELLNARSFAKILANEPEKLDWCVAEFAKMLRLIHGTEVPAGKLPDMKERALDWAAFMKDYLPKEAADKLYALVEAIPHDDHMLHGDYHTKNLELQNDEVLLIDMDTLSVGNPIFELGSMYNAFLGFSELDHSIVRKYQGFDRELSATFWQKSLAAYLGTSCPTKIREVEDKARVIGYTRMIRRAIRRDGLQTETGRAEIAHWKGELLELLRSTDTLLFDRNELEIEAVRENLEEVLAFLGERLDAADCTPKARMQLELAVEEIFVNIASYAYNPETGKATVRVEVSGDPLHVTITFIDRGVPYDPLAKADPDLSASAQERTVGGLGIFLTKKLMDDVVYEYRGGRNVLTLKKNLE
jgi:uncharacterized protein (TIGR02172 family)